LLLLRRMAADAIAHQKWRNILLKADRRLGRIALGLFRRPPDGCEKESHQRNRQPLAHSIFTFHSNPIRKRCVQNQTTRRAPPAHRLPTYFSLRYTKPLPPRCTTLLTLNQQRI